MATLANMRALLARRETLQKELRELADDGANFDDSGVATGEAAAKIAVIQKLLADLATSLDARARIDEYERRDAGGTRILDGADQGFERSCQQFSLTRFIQHQLAVREGRRPDVDGGNELEISAELQRRGKARGRQYEGAPVPLSALSLNGPMRRSVGTRAQQTQLETRVISTTLPAGGAGSALIPLDLSADEFIDVLRPNVVVRSLGARVLTDCVGNLDLPKQLAPATTGWVPDNSPFPTSDVPFGRVSFRPKLCGTIVEWSRLMLLQSNPGVEGILRADLAAVLARELDRAVLVGSGAANEPLGIVAHAGTTHVPDGQIGINLVADLIGALTGLNALQGSLGFAGAGAVRTMASKATDAMYRPFGFDTLFQSMPMEWTNILAPDLLVFGSWQDAVIAIWGPEIDLVVNPYGDTSFSKGNVQLRAIMVVDTNLRHAESFSWSHVSAQTIP
jgi:HK97 family phage major capsid protein